MNQIPIPENPNKKVISSTGEKGNNDEESWNSNRTRKLGDSIEENEKEKKEKNQTWSHPLISDGWLRKGGEGKLVE